MKSQRVTNCDGHSIFVPKKRSGTAFAGQFLRVDGIVYATMVSPGNIRLALAILVTTAIIGIVAAVSLKGSRRAAPPEPISRQLPQNIDMALHDARFYEVREGTTVWELVAKQADYDKNGDIAHLSDIRMEFAKTPTSGAITVKAAKGTYSSKSRNIALRGKVHVVTEGGASFDTEAIDYVASRSQFRTADDVTFRQNRLVLTARGMEFDATGQQARFLNNIDARVAGLKAQ